MLIISIYRAGVSQPILSARPNNETSAVKQSIMGECLLSLSFELDTMIDLRIGDYTDLFGSRYYVHSSRVPLIKKLSKYKYEYTLDMVSTQYLLQNAQYMFLGDDNSLRQPDFSLYGTAADFIDLLISNAARTGFPFKKGGVVTTEYKSLTFENVNCLAALGTLGEQFGTEWYVEGFTVNLAKKLSQTPYTFQYGKGKGMYDITRRPADGSSIVTRLYTFGGIKNIPVTYRNGSERLLLPAVSDPKLISDVTYSVVNNGNGTQTMVFYWNKPADPTITKTTVNMRLTTGTNTVYTVYTAPVVAGLQGTVLITVPVGTYELYFETFTGSYVSAGTTPAIIITGSSPYAVLSGTAQPYIEYNADQYGVIEGTLTFDDIYPHRTGIVRAVDATDPFVFTDADIDFDVNAQLLPGTSAKVIFNTGQLAGYAFKIKAPYDNTNKKFTLLKNEDEKTLDMPSEFFRPAIGDEYVLVDIIMPQSYIDAAEALLLQKAQDYLNTYSSPVYSYSVTCDPKYFRQQKISLQYGDVVNIIDLELGINRAIRILSVTKKLDDEYNYSIELGETVSPGLISSIKSSLTSNSNNISDLSTQISNSKASEGTFSTLTIENVDTASDVSAMKQLYIDANGKVWKH